MNQLKTGDIIGSKRKELGFTQNQLAKMLNISFQAVSKWENNTAYPDIEMLPKLAAALHTTVDRLLGYQGAAADYDSRYDTEEYYWGITPNHICYDIMKFLPPVKPYRVLDMGCGGVRMLSSLPNAVITYPPSIFQSRGLRKPGTWPGIIK